MSERIYNLDHVGTLPGGMGMPFDRAIVVDTARTEPNILTGEAQPVTVYRGTLSGAHAYVEAARRARGEAPNA